MERMMGRTIAISLLAILPLLACGCAAPSQTGNPSNASTKSAEALRPCLQGHGFAVLYFRALRDTYGNISVIGEVRNIGVAARGVELQAVLRDDNGRAVAVGNFCPASYQNIAPGETWPFSYGFGKQQGIHHAEMRIVGSFRTLDMPGNSP